MKNFGRASQRFSGLSGATRAIIVVSALFIFFWLAAFFWFLTKEQAEFISELQIDKLAHFAGGFLSAGLVFLAQGRTPRAVLIGMVLAAGVLWEIWEVIFLPDQFARFRMEFALWTADSLFDLVADVLGAYFLLELNERDQALD